MTLIEIAGVGLLTALSLATLLWLYSLLSRKQEVMEPLWGIGLTFLNAVYFYLAPSLTARHWLLLVLVSAWGCQLTWRLSFANHPAAAEGSAGLSRLLWQGVRMFFVSAPLFMVQTNATPRELTTYDYAGLGLFMFAFAFEMIADWQLNRFLRKNPSSPRIMTTGLWSLTRHPLYFADALVWSAFFVIALSVSSGYLTIFAPVMMSYHLKKLMGVEDIEAELAKEEAGYAEYRSNTPVFFPKLIGRRKP